MIMLNTTNIKLYILFLSILLALSCNSLKYKSPIKIDADQKHGYKLLYNDSLKMITLTHYKHEVKDGIEIIFFESGEVAQYGKYKKGVKNGWFYYFILVNKKQKLVKKIKFKNGKNIKTDIYNINW